jgi:RNA polymerase sigma factor (sigma-70 family)
MSLERDPRMRGSSGRLFRVKWSTAESNTSPSGTYRVMESSSSDADVLARSLREPRAFELLFDRHFDAVHRYLHRRGGRDLADELAAETFALAFERRASCRSTGSVLPWLYGIATNLLRRSQRVERRQLSAFARGGVNDWVAYEDETARVEDASHGAELARALAAMKPRERDALLLYAVAELTYEEIALALEVPVGTVATWLHRARAIARRELATEPDVLSFATTGANGNG